MPLSADRYLDELRADAAALAAAVRAAPSLDAPVPMCGDWNVGDLLEHIGMVHVRVSETVGRRATAWIRPEELPAPPSARDQLLGWYEEGASRLAQTLAAAGPDADVWNWAQSENKAAFWFRRMAQETLVHRTDAERAAGVVSTIDHDMAVDGIDEFVDEFLPLGTSYGVTAGVSGSLHLHATDGDGEWFVGFNDGAVEVRHEHAKGDVAVRGPAADLLLLVWNRRSPEGLEVFGDQSLLEVWSDKIRI